MWGRRGGVSAAASEPRLKVSKPEARKAKRTRKKIKQGKCGRDKTVQEGISIGEAKILSAHASQRPELSQLGKVDRVCAKRKAIVLQVVIARCNIGLPVFSCRPPLKSIEALDPLGKRCARW